MNGSQITDSPIGAVLLIIGSVIAVMALVCVIIQIYKNHISDRSMCREIYGTDKPAKHKSVPKKLKALEERFRELNIPPVYSFTGNCYCEHFTITVKREFIFYVCCHTVGGETLDKKLFLNFEKQGGTFSEVMDIVLKQSTEKKGIRYTLQELAAEEKETMGI